MLSFVTYLTFLDGKVIDNDNELLAIDSNGLLVKAGDGGRFHKGDPVTLCIRPERILIGEGAKGCNTIHTARIITYDLLRSIATVHG